MSSNVEMVLLLKAEKRRDSCCIPIIKEKIVAIPMPVDMNTKLKKSTEKESLMTDIIRSKCNITTIISVVMITIASKLVIPRFPVRT